jgi:hypothetical protein
MYTSTLRFIPIAVIATLVATVCGDPQTAGSERNATDAYEAAVWDRRIEAAFEPSECAAAPETKREEGYYSGKLIDTHFHMPHLPDYPPGAGAGEKEIDGFEESEYADWGIGPDAENARAGQQPLAGLNVTMTEIACVLASDGTDGAFAFFPVFPSHQEQLLRLASRTLDAYGDLFIPFIMPPGEHDVPPTVDGGTLSEILKFQPGLFKGYGEIGLYGIAGKRTDADYPPDAPIFRNLYPVVETHRLMVYLHPGDGQVLNFANALAEFPQITFIVHGDQIETAIVDLMERFSNIYYTVDAIYGDQYLLRPEESPESFQSTLNDYAPLLQADLTKWKDVIEAHPTRFMWGTDRGGNAVWTYDLEVSRRLVDYGRSFIGRLDPSVQDLFAYQNAERLAAGSQ